MSQLARAAESVCSIRTNGTGFMVGDGCIMTAAHVLKEALGKKHIWNVVYHISISI